MYKIVVADDEQMVRMVLSQTIADYLDGKCIIKNAGNGREAIACALEMEADIVFMDIRMPGIDGLEAIAGISGKLPDCKFIILTAYDEFGYAQKAIRLGVFHYLLKPCEDEELFATIDEVIEMIDKESEQKQEQKQLTGRLQRLEEEIEGQIILYLMDGNVHTDFIVRKLGELGIHFSAGLFLIIRTRQIMNARDFMLSKQWPEYVNWVKYIYQDKLYLFLVSDKKEINFFEKIDEMLRMIADEYLTLYGECLQRAFGLEFWEIEDAGVSCLQAQIALKYCSEENPVFVFESRTRAGRRGVGNLLTDSVLAGDFTMISNVIECRMGSLEISCGDWAKVLEKIEFSMRKCMEGLQEETGMLLPKVDWHAIRMKDRKDVQEMLSDIFIKISILLKRSCETQSEEDFRSIQILMEEYMENHYQEDITLADMARDLHYSSSYLCRLFKQCFQENFVIYLTKLRMQKAVQLLCTSEDTIKEVAEKVGYKDSNYFTKVFRKETGKRPSDYRKGR